MIWDFEIFIRDLSEFSDDQAEALYGTAGCNDGLLASSNGRASISFGREAPTLQAAIASAIADIKSVGLIPGSVLIEDIDQYCQLPEAV